MRYYPVFDNLFDDFFTTDAQGTSSVMKTDIVEKDGNYELSIEMPGVKKEDIQMELKDGYLNVTASHNTDKEDKEGRIIRKERVSGSYSRSFYVGEDIHTEDVKASFNNGELIVTVPKEAPKKIEENKFIPIE
ncbi:Hsp20/alpha crystallin family protein [Holdemanella biformis]|uniref:Hsp20/alpha crystallin family protein n=1 Tax=Holdemanella biformis TaxID=1735 RepID=UPI0026702157|nr:Hsp20/alpha crystallin family protein [Holdemanella biformis]